MDQISLPDSVQAIIFCIVFYDPECRCYICMSEEHVHGLSSVSECASVNQISLPDSVQATIFCIVFYDPD